MIQVAGLDYPPQLLNGNEVAVAWRLAHPRLPRPPSAVLVDMEGGPQYFVGAGLVARLASLGYTAMVPSRWSVQFGPAQLAHRPAQTTITLQSLSAPSPPGFTFLGDADPATAVYIAQDQRPLSGAPRSAEAAALLNRGSMISPEKLLATRPSSTPEVRFG